MILLEAVPKFQLYNIFSTILFLNLSMFRFLSTYGIYIKLGYTYVDDMLKFSRKSKTGNMLSRTLNITNPNSEKMEN